jgi:quercetin dioxygenase-like cupin family protein
MSLCRVVTGKSSAQRYCKLTLGVANGGPGLSIFKSALSILATLLLVIQNVKSLPMPVLIEKQTKALDFREGANRKLVHTDNLMVVVIDFFNGPWSAPDPYHHHVHEQITYVAAGEILFLCEGEKAEKLRAGDLFSVPSGKPHTIQLLSEKARLVDSFSPVREDFLS